MKSRAILAPVLITALAAALLSAAGEGTGSSSFRTRLFKGGCLALLAGCVPLRLYALTRSLEAYYLLCPKEEWGKAARYARQAPERAL